MKEKNPCINCLEREAGCHTRCPDGRAHEAREKKRRERIKTEKSKESVFLDCKLQTIGKIKKVIGR